MYSRCLLNSRVRLEGVQGLVTQGYIIVLASALGPT